jgi:L-glyceraldehyde 3-phosphate reductase
MKTLFRKFIDKKGDIMSWHPYPAAMRICNTATVEKVACACLRCRLVCGIALVTSSLDAQRALLRKAFDLGITHFDLANNYGHRG